MSIEHESMTELAAAPTLAESDRLAISRLKSVAGMLLLLLAAVSFAAGVPGLMAAGSWAMLGSLSWLCPLLIDGGLIFMAASAAVYKGETGRAAFLPWTLVVVLSGVSVASQVVHVLGAANWVLTPEAVTGAVVASLFPLVVLSSTRIYETLRFGQLIDREAKRAGRGRGRAVRPATARPAAAATLPATPQAPSQASRPKPQARPAAAAIDPAVKQEAVARVASGESERSVAAALGISRGAIQNWRKAPA